MCQEQLSSGLLSASRTQAASFCRLGGTNWSGTHGRILEVSRGRGPLPLGAHWVAVPLPAHLHTQPGFLADHWLFFWHVMAFCPTSSKAGWHSIVSVSP